MRDFRNRSTAGPATRESGHRRPMRQARSAFCAGAVASAVLATPSAAQETPAEIIAAHIRRQGYVCENALRAERNRKASKPDEPVWILRCNNATYRVRLIPDMAAQVETIKQ